MTVATEDSGGPSVLLHPLGLREVDSTPLQRSSRLMNV